jgi:MFS family permease
LAQTVSSTFVVVVGLGAIAGVLVTGLLADRLVAKGWVAARMQVGAGAYFLAVAALIPAMLLPNLAGAAPFMFVAAGGLGGAFPPVDAARLDVMHSRLWGRAEGVRSTIVYLAQAASPPLFGWLSAMLGGGGHDGGAFGPASAPGAQAGGGNLDMTFVVMLIALLAAAVVLLLGARSYPRDVATAVASERATRDAHPRQAMDY